MKKVKLLSCIVVNRDEKGELTLVGKAKEAINAMAKKKIQVDICIDEEGLTKEDLKKFLEENNVTVNNIFTKDEKPEKEEYDAVVLGGSKLILHRNDWQWTLNDIVDKLFGPQREKEHYSEQKQMDDAMDGYISWAKKANKTASGRSIG